LEIEFFLRIQIFNREMQKSLDFGPESIGESNNTSEIVEEAII